MWLSFYIKQLPEELAGKSTCLEENTEKYITFLVPIEVTRTDKKGKEFTKTISYKLQLVDSRRFIANSSSNLTELIHKIKCKYRYDNEKCEMYRITYKDCECWIVYPNFKQGLIE